MNKLNFAFLVLKKNPNYNRILLGLITSAMFILPVFFSNFGIRAQKRNALPADHFLIGEKLTYNVSFEKFNNAAYAELYVVSRGKLSGRDVIELHSKIKTNELVSAAYYQLDEVRQTFASIENGHPLYVRKIEDASGLPNETIANYLSAPTENYDLLSLIYSLRYFGAEGVFPLTENGKNYTLNFQNIGSEDVRTDAGQYETIISGVTGDYLTEKNFTNLKINFTKDERKIPVLIRFRTSRGEFKASLASVQTIEGDFTENPTPTPIPSPPAVKTPKPVPTATPYIDNLPLSEELPFKLGETLEYRIASGGKPVGNVVLQAAARQIFGGKDSLLLTALVTSSSQGNNIFSPGDGIQTYVNPIYLTPTQSEIKFNGTFNFLNQKLLFEQSRGIVTLTTGGKVEVPVNTHSILSFIYALRSFNLKPSKDPTNPVNDTRVAVIYDDKPYVFTLRPATADLINLQGEKVSSQLISITTGNPQIDALGLSIWLSNDEKRLPLRLKLGSFQADLINETGSTVK